MFCSTTKCVSDISGLPEIYQNDLQQSLIVEEKKLLSQGVTKIILLATDFSVPDSILSHLQSVDLSLSVLSYSNSSWSNYGTQSLPTTSLNAKKKPVLSLSLFAYGSYLGVIDVAFNAQGDISSVASNPILIAKCKSNSTATPYQCTEEDPQITSFLNSLLPMYNQTLGVILSSTNVSLTNANSVCRRKDCLLGRLMAHSVRESSDLCQIALVNSGAIRQDLKAGNISLGDVYNTYPFSEKISVAQLSGRVIYESLENSVSLIPPNSDNPETWSTALSLGGTGRFLHVAGMNYQFDSTREPYSRIFLVEVQVDPTLHVYQPLDLNQTYRVCTIGFILNGGDNYTAIAANIKSKIDVTDSLQSAIVNHINASNPLNIPANASIWENTYQQQTVCGSLDCIHGICKTYGECSCFYGWIGVNCNDTNALNQTSIDCDSMQSHEFFDLKIAQDVSMGGFIYQNTILFGFGILALYFSCRGWIFYLRHWSICRREPDTIQDPVFYNQFTIKRTRRNLIAIFIFILEGSQLFSYPISANVNWVWMTGFKTVATLPSTTLPEIWIFWLFSSLALLWVLYCMIFMMEWDLAISNFSWGRLFLTPSAMYLSIVASAAYAPALNAMLNAFNCRY
eukprot:Sdes_comp18753_c0_seq1m9133